MAPEYETPGRRTLATVVDAMAKECPTRTVCKAPNGPQATDGFSAFTMEELSKAVDSTAVLIVHSLGKAGKDEVLVYLGDNDIRYLVFVVACQKTGYKPFLPSVKNPSDIQAKLLEQTGCSGILFSASYAEHAQSVGDSTPALVQVPDVELMVANFNGSVPYNTAYAAVEDESAIIIHSSGTTGIPKTIPLTHGFLGTLDKQSHVPVPEGRQSAIPNRLSRDSDLFLSTAPFSHIMGIFAQVMSIYNGTPFVYPPPSAMPLTVDRLVQTITAAHPTVAVITPSLVEATARSASALQTLSTLRMVCIGGAPLAPEIGAALNQRTNLVSVMGASELGLVLSLIPQHKADWEFFEWNPNYGVRMDACGGDSDSNNNNNNNNNLYELVIPRPETRENHGIFHTFPSLETEYRTKDLFSPHPARPNLWKYEGRLDDTITLINGTKINPVPMEKAIESHAFVSRAVVIGQRRSRTAVLVEPAEGSQTVDELIRDRHADGDQDPGSPAHPSSSVSAFARAIWPAVERANEFVPAEARIGIMRVGLAVAGKPFRTTPKGSTQRRRVIEGYEAEVDGMYAREEYWYNMLRNG